MESYQTWFGDGRELSILRMLGLFDLPRLVPVYSKVQIGPIKNNVWRENANGRTGKSIVRLW